MLYKTECRSFPFHRNAKGSDDAKPSRYPAVRAQTRVDLLHPAASGRLHGLCRNPLRDTVKDYRPQGSHAGCQLPLRILRPVFRSLLYQQIYQQHPWNTDHHPFPRHLAWPVSATDYPVLTTPPGNHVLFIWMHRTLPRLHYDQLMQPGWKVLTPLMLLNIVATAFRMFIKP